MPNRPSDQGRLLSSRPCKEAEAALHVAILGHPGRTARGSHDYCRAISLSIRKIARAVTTSRAITNTETTTRDRGTSHSGTVRRERGQPLSRSSGNINGLRPRHADHTGLE